MKKEKTSLVTGGAGFIGSHVADYLIQEGHKVLIVDDLSGGFRENVNPKAVFYEGSVTDEDFLDKIFFENNVDYIFHLAAYAAEGLSHFIRKFNYENNLIGSVNLINRAVRNKVKHFVFTSSIAVYGTNQTPMIETLIPQPEDPYGVAKYTVEMDLKAAHEMFGLTYTIFRPHNVYGERQNHSDPYRNVLGIFINNMMKGKPMTVFGDGKQTRAFSYIGDVAPYIARSIEIPEAKNEIFNIGADKPFTVLELAKTIAKAMGAEPKLEYLPARNEVMHAFADHSKAKKVFGINSETELDTGIRKMVEWSKNVGPKDPKKFGNIEIKYNLPPSWQKLSQSMKIITVAATPFFSDRGCHVRIYNEAKYLQKFGAEVRICTYHFGYDTPEFEAKRTSGAKWYKKTAPGFSWGKIWLDLKLIFLVRREIKKFKPDVLHAHLWEGLGVAYWAKKMAFKKEIPIIFDLQGDLEEEFKNYNRKNVLARKIFTWLSKKAINWCDWLVLSSPNAVLPVEKMFKNKNRLAVVEDGTDLDLFQNPPEMSKEDKAKIEKLKAWTNGKKVLVYIGGLSDGKGTGKLLEVFSKFAKNNSGWKLILAGFGVSEEKYREYVRKNNLEEFVNLPGRIGYFAGPHLFSLADAAVDPKSGSAEGSVKLVSYMAAGLPAICFENEFNWNKLGEAGYFMREMDDLQNILPKIEKGERIQYEKLSELSEEKEARKLFDIFQSLVK